MFYIALKSVRMYINMYYKYREEYSFVLYVSNSRDY